MSVKIDFKKTLKDLYQPNSKVVVEVIVPKMHFLMIDGMGSPGEAKAYSDALAVLYPVAYKIKFLSKAKGNDYIVPPLEGLWWADDMNDFTKSNRDKWKWTMMIMTPEWITKELFKEAIENVRKSKPELKDLLFKLRFETYDENKSAQIMHIGPYSEEGPTIKKIHNFIQSKGGKFNGQILKHHEIYLSDPRKSKPTTMKTVIRQPYR